MSVPAKRPASPIESSKPSKMSAQQPSIVTAPPASAGLLIKRLTPAAQLPTRGSTLAAGYDMYAAVEKVVPAHGKALVSTGISIAVPEGTYGRVAPRSGLASKFSIHTGAGVIDADYRGEVFVLLFNLGDAEFKASKLGKLWIAGSGKRVWVEKDLNGKGNVNFCDGRQDISRRRLSRSAMRGARGLSLALNVGDRIAQLILERIVTPDVVEVDLLHVLTSAFGYDQDLDATARGSGGFGSTGGFTAAGAVGPAVIPSSVNPTGATEDMATIVQDGANVI
ncbi:hypothetical protein QFC21_005801 [Naganishia friedmannii]|uniref:Uncharacterized protein n=1 Tax=Naganishia friedmannii TaxID=89922 RepID=A0ACC2V790_9TREE|nr:hypothetical protein QFC21_005801 [Naganishia friedmannii]